MTVLLGRLWTEDDGQDIAEYAVMLAVILVLVVGTIRLVGSNARTPTMPFLAWRVRFNKAESLEVRERTIFWGRLEHEASREEQC